MYDFDVIVIGGGSAGFAAAGRAVENGARTAIVEAGKLGGDCPNRACVPTKTLLQSAKVYQMARKAEEFGVLVGGASFDWSRIMARKNRVVDQLTGARLEGVLDRRGISLFPHRAVFSSNHQIRLDGKTVSAEKFIIATGSRPKIPPIEGLPEAGFITSNEAVELDRLPESIAIIGGGPVGLEFAQLFSAFGVKTTVVESTGRLLRLEDLELAESLKTYIKDSGVEVIARTGVDKVEPRAGRKALSLRSDSGRRELVVDEIMVAVGREPAVEGLDLPAAGVELNAAGIKVGRHLETSSPTIWACGDVTGKLLYTHFATYQGDLAGFNAGADTPDEVDYAVVPKVTFTDPPIASIGLTETEAKQKYGNIRIGRMPLRYLGKSLITGDRRGLVKLVAEGDRIIGGHILGDSAGELIHEVALAMKGAINIETLAELIHAYPTTAEGIGSAAAEMTAWGMSIEEAA